MASCDVVSYVCQALPGSPALSPSQQSTSPPITIRCRPTPVRTTVMNASMQSMGSEYDPPVHASSNEKPR